MERNSVLRLKQRIKEILSLDINDLLGIERFGSEGGFIEIQSDFIRTFDLLKHIHDMSLDNLPDTVINHINIEIKEFSVTIERFTNSNMGQLAVSDYRNNLINEFSNKTRKLYTNISPLISYQNAMNIDKLTQKSIDAFSSEVTKAKSEASSYLTEIQMITQNAKKVFTDLQEAAGKIAVSNYAIFFGDEAKINKISSNRWFAGILASSLLTIAFVLVSFKYFPIPDNASISTIVHYTSTKLIVLSILYFLIVWCAKNFNSHRHNYIINRHRENALTTFKAFVDAAEEDVNVKNAVLLQATWSIFSVQNTGYSKDGSETESPNKLIEICTNLGQSITSPKLNP